MPFEIVLFFTLAMNVLHHFMFNKQMWDSDKFEYVTRLIIKGLFYLLLMDMWMNFCFGPDPRR